MIKKIFTYLHKFSTGKEVEASVELRVPATGSVLILHRKPTGGTERIAIPYESFIAMVSESYRMGYG